MKTLTVVIFICIVLLCLFFLLVSIGGYVASSNPDSQIDIAVKNALEKQNLESSIDIEMRLKNAPTMFLLTMVPIVIYLIGSTGILFFKNKARQLIIISPLIIFAYDIITSSLFKETVRPFESDVTLGNTIVTYLILAIPSIYLLLPKVKEQFK